MCVLMQIAVIWKIFQSTKSRIIIIDIIKKYDKMYASISKVLIISVISQECVDLLLEVRNERTAA